MVMIKSTILRAIPYTILIGLFLAFNIVSFAAVAADCTITTIAGDVEAEPYEGGALTGDDGPALGAKLNNPVDIAVDSDGNIYIADLGNARVRKVSPDGAITTFAGGVRQVYQNGRYTYGDGGLAIQANLRAPAGVAVDSDGSVYIADSNWHVIRKVSPDGNISTIAGTGSRASTRVIEEGVALETPLSFPIDVTLGPDGSIYFVEKGTRRVRKISDGIVTTVAGNGSDEFMVSGDGGSATEAGIGTPEEIFVDSAGNLYITASEGGVEGSTVISDIGNETRGETSIQKGTIIRKVTPDGKIYTIAGGGAVGLQFFGTSNEVKKATDFGFGGPVTGIALDSAGNIYLVDSYTSQIRKVDPSGNLTTVVGKMTVGWPQDFGDGGPARDARFYEPRGIAIDSADNMYISDSGAHRVRKITNVVACTQAQGNLEGRGGTVGKDDGTTGDGTSTGVRNTKIGEGCSLVLRDK